MHIWLVDDCGLNQAGLEPILRELERRQDTDVQIVGAAPFQADFALAMSKLPPDLLDVVVVRERAWPVNGPTQEVLDLGVGMVIAADAERIAPFRSFAEYHPLCFVPARPDTETLHLALVTALCRKHSQAHWKSQLEHLQQRLNDRIVIERAKGILNQRLGISEEEAYKRLRLLSRRQRRQIRDIAQSLLDTQGLFAPDVVLDEADPSTPNGKQEPGLVSAAG
jgi:response regulator NasT